VIDNKKLKIVWFSGFPAHYMAEFHVRLEREYQGLHFIYVPLGDRGLDFSHEQLSLPENMTILPAKNSYLASWRALNALNPEAILISGNYPRPNLIAALWAKYKRHPIYYWSDSNAQDRKNIHRSRLNQFFLKRLLLAMTKLLYIGKNNKNFYISVCGYSEVKNKLQFFPLPHPCDAFETTIKKPQDKLIFLVLGRLVDVKAVDHAIHAMALISQDDRKKCQMLIAGNGPSKLKLEKLVKQLDLSEVVSFLGSIPSTQAPQIFSQADIVLVPSHQEPWGLVVNEALSSGKPVITPNWVGSCADLIVNHQTGIVISDNLPNTIANAMKFFIDNPTKAKEMGLAGRQLIRDGGWNIHQSVEVFGKILYEIH
jgi:glycosyltransferase involved in cell wall biosynthesis